MTAPPARRRAWLEPVDPRHFPFLRHLDRSAGPVWCAVVEYDDHVEERFDGFEPALDWVLAAGTAELWVCPVGAQRFERHSATDADALRAAHGE